MNGVVYLVWERDKLFGVLSEEKFNQYIAHIQSNKLTWGDWISDDDPFRKHITGYLPDKKTKIPVIRIMKIIVDGVYF